MHAPANNVRAGISEITFIVMISCGHAHIHARTDAEAILCGELRGSGRSYRARKTTSPERAPSSDWDFNGRVRAHILYKSR